MSKSEYAVIEGDVVFAYLTSPDSYMGTEKYSVTLNLTDDSVKLLKDKGVKVKEYEKDGVVHLQKEAKRKAEFGPPLIFDAEGDVLAADAISWGDTVRVAISIGAGNALGRGVYMNKVKLVKKNPEAKESGAADNAGDF
jgi:hypothetical protein